MAPSAQVRSSFGTGASSHQGRAWRSSFCAQCMEAVSQVSSASKIFEPKHVTHTCHTRPGELPLECAAAHSSHNSDREICLFAAGSGRRSSEAARSMNWRRQSLWELAQSADAASLPAACTDGAQPECARGRGRLYFVVTGRSWTL